MQIRFAERSVLNDLDVVVAYPRLIRALLHCARATPRRVRDRDRAPATWGRAIRSAGSLCAVVVADGAVLGNHPRAAFIGGCDGTVVCTGPSVTESNPARFSGANSLRSARGEASDLRLSCRTRCQRQPIRSHARNVHLRRRIWRSGSRAHAGRRRVAVSARAPRHILA